MTVTRALMQRNIYKHLIETLMDLDPEGPIPKALEADRSTTVADIISLTASDIAALRFKTTDSEGKETISPLGRGEQRHILIITSFVIHKRSLGHPMLEKDWLLITTEEFQKYRTSPDFIDITHGTGTTNTTQLQGTSQPPTGFSGGHRTRDTVYDFKRGIKRDPSQFPVLKDDKQWDLWNQDTKAQARSQDVIDVLLPTYKPTTPEETELFDEKQKFMYAVFMKTIQTDTGKSYVRANEATYDAQNIYTLLTTHASTSTKAAMDSTAIMSYITSVRLGDGKWRGSSNGFVLNWVNQIRKYEAITPTTDHFSDGQKRTMLENAVSTISDLRAIKAQADQHKTHTGTTLTFSQYLALLTSATTTYDASFANRPNKKPSTRQVYAHETYDQSDDYTIDSNVDDFHDNLSIEINQAFRQPRLSLQQWKRLTPEAQVTWDLLDDTAKRTILEKRLSNPHFGKPNPGPSGGTTTSNLHDMFSDFLIANLHDSHIGGDNDATSVINEGIIQPDSDTTMLDQLQQTPQILANAAKTPMKQLPPGDVSRLLSSKMSKTQQQRNTKSNDNGDITVNGVKYRQCNSAAIIYSASPHRRSEKGSLVDRGCNGGICGNDTRIISASDRTVDVQGIDNHRMTDIRIVQAGAVTKTQKGDVIIIMNQYAHSPTARTIHSSAQLEAYKADVNDKSIKIPGGLQRIKTLDGYLIPLNIRAALPYMKIRPFTDNEWDTLPHVILTSDTTWDPSILDNDITGDEKWYDAHSDLPDEPNESLFDEFGNYRRRVVCHARIVDSDLDDKIIPTDTLMYEIHERVVKPKEPNYAELKPQFGWVPEDIIKKTYEATTQYARIPMSTLLTRHYKSPFPALNVPRRQEPIATDTIYSDTPAIDSGATQAQFYVGTKTFVTDVYGMKTDKEFVNTLSDQIRERGAPDKLLSDSAQVETSQRVLDILRAYVIGAWQSEPLQQQQNPAERHYQTAKRMTNTVMDRTNSPAYTWLLALMYVCFLLNHLAHTNLQFRTPLEALTGTTPDISPLLRFHWWQRIYYKIDDSDFPSDSLEKSGRFVGIAEHVGHAMTYKILTDDTKKVIHRSNVRSANDPASANLKADLFSGENYIEFIKSARREIPENSDTEPANMMIIQPADLIGRTFLTNPQDDGQRFRARIVEAIDDHQQLVADNPALIKFRCSINNDQYEEIMAYNDIIQRIEQDDDEDTTVWRYQRITAHEGPLPRTHPNYKGSKFNVMIEWENGEITSEPLTTIAADDPVSCAIYARDKDLLDTEGWRRFKGIARRQKKLFRMANQAKLRSFRMAPKYMYGFEIPRDYKHAEQLDRRNGNDKWVESTRLEMEQHQEYETFTDKGKDASLPDFKKIRVHLIYAVKHDSRHKARLVADGHLTDVPVDSVYSGVVSLKGLRMLLFLAELNNLQTWATDIGNAYLEAKTSEKVYVIAGPEFGVLQGHTLIIFKALYGLRTSGLRWHERFSIVLKSEGFSPCIAEPDIWMRANKGVYEYIAVYVDDLAFAMHDPEGFSRILCDKHKFKLKGTGEIAFHLGCDFYRDIHGVLCMQPAKYIDKMIAGYERMFGEKPKQLAQSPLEKSDHPELDISELLDHEGVQQYQSLIGSMQWAVSLGRFDIATAVMTLSGFRAAPRQGHLERAKRVIGYLAKMKHAVIRFRVDIPDLSDLEDIEYDWEHSVYGDVSEALPHNAPAPLGKPVVLIHYVDANLLHDMLTGRSVTGILHFLNQCPIEWFSKKQATVETATYGSEFVAARTTVEQAIDLRATLRYLGVPIQGKSYMFGDNESVVGSSTRFDAKLHKRHTILSFHRVREAIAAKIVGFFHIPGSLNPADVLTKHWAYNQVWKHLRPILFWQGDTADIDDVAGDTPSVEHAEDVRPSAAMPNGT